MKGRKSRQRARSPEVIAEIVALRAAGKHQQVIADLVGVSQAHVCKVIASERGSQKHFADSVSAELARERDAMEEAAMTNAELEAIIHELVTRQPTQEAKAQ